VFSTEDGPIPDGGREQLPFFAFDRRPGIVIGSAVRTRTAYLTWRRLRPRVSHAYVFDVERSARVAGSALCTRSDARHEEPRRSEVRRAHTFRQGVDRGTGRHDSGEDTVSGRIRPWIAASNDRSVFSPQVADGSVGFRWISGPFRHRSRRSMFSQARVRPVGQVPYRRRQL